jgi:exodeoxyribonuclease X
MNEGYRAHLRVIDLETVGFLKEQPGAIRQDPARGIVEIGYTDVAASFRADGSFFGATIELPGSLLFNPPGGIPAESCGVHHITPKMVEGLPACRSNDALLLVNGEPKPMALVACNSEFEREWLQPYLPEATKWICALKVAARLHPGWPAHGNQAVRYLLGHELDERWASPPHRAGPDSWVTAHNLVAFLKEGCAVRQMVEWTLQPRYMTTCPIGQHRGKPWIEVPADFLRWMLDKATDMDPDLLYWARQSLQDRQRLAQQPDLASSDYA